ncbi:AAA family ATPase [Undibacterium sp.]|uniref:AAA family ATPase n=1 Tax=Undibacterium sp. TaxID=1914977 RepID=UPI002731C11C|nr:AAA family ATPase [Undibacterium sp.]MDP1977633.1 AAA family ATPase [Undibacterium sp.]
MTILNLEITSVFVEGYKGFKKRAVINLSSLTLVFGENSAGKSSILRLLVSISKAITLKSVYPLLPVNVDGEESGFSALLTGEGSSPLEIGFTFKELGKDNVHFEVKYVISYLREINRALITEFHITKNGLPTKIFLLDIDNYTSPYQRENTYLCNQSDSGILEKYIFSFEGLAPKIFHSSNSIPHELLSDIIAIENTLIDFSESIIWVGPLRGSSRSYCKQKEYCVNLGDEKSLPKRHQ